MGANNCSIKPKPIHSNILIQDDMNPEELLNYQNGKMHENRAQYEQAQDYYILALRNNPKSAIFYCGLGNCKLKIGDYMRALDFYQRAIDIDCNCKYAYNGLGIIYQNVKNDTQSIDNFNKAIQIDPKFSYPYNGLGNLYYARKNNEQALKNYEIALKLQPKNIIILANIACCQMGLGKKQQGIVTFKKVQQSVVFDEYMSPTNRIYLKTKLAQFQQAVQKAQPKYQRQFQQLTNNMQVDGQKRVNV